MSDRPVDGLWRDYLFLSKELVKFSARNENKMVGVLLEQRSSLQQMIEEQGDTEYHNSPAGKKILIAIRDQNSMLSRLLQLSRNKGKKKHELEQAYSQHVQRAGSFINRKG